jgi:hypothetical protein
MPPETFQALSGLLLSPLGGAELLLCGVALVRQPAKFACGVARGSGQESLEPLTMRDAAVRRYRPCRSGLIDREQLASGSFERVCERRHGIPAIARRGVTVIVPDER